MTLSRNRIIGILAITGFLVIVGMAGWQFVAALDESRARAASLESIAQQQRAQARMWQIQADSYQKQAEVLATRAAKRDTVTMVRYRSLRDTLIVPDTCAAIVGIQDSVIAQLDSAVAESQSAYLEEKQATEAVRAQVLGLESAYDSLHTAYTLLAHPPRLNLLARLKPDIRPGLFAGLCTSGTPCAGVGLTLSWRF